MKKRYNEEQIISAIKEHEAGAKVNEICRRLSISSGTFYNWRSKYAGLGVNEAKRLRELEQENNKLKRLLAEKLLEVDAMKDVLSKKWYSRLRKQAAKYMIETQLSESASGLSPRGYQSQCLCLSCPPAKRCHASRTFEEVGC
jgi:putative transposase